MNTNKQTIALFLSIVLSLLSTANAQELDGDTRLDSAWANTSEVVTTLAETDRHLLSALKAIDKSARKASLHAAQIALDTTLQHSGSLSGTDSANAESIDWLVQTERSLGRFEEQTQKGLRESLMQKLWASPYGQIQVDNLSILETISDALRLLREIQRLGGGDAEALKGLQETYWSVLLSYQRDSGLDYSAIVQGDINQVFDQRVLRGQNGEIQLYQLTNTADQMLLWAQVLATDVPIDFLASEALTVDLSRESASWVLVMDGEGLAKRVNAHKHWLASIEGDVRLVLLERGDYALALRNLSSDWFSSNRRVPYVLQGSSKKTPEQLYLIQVAGNRILGSWPLPHLDSSGNTSLKILINRILAATNRQ